MVDQEPDHLETMLHASQQPKPDAASARFKQQLYAIAETVPQGRVASRYVFSLPELVQPAFACASALAIGLWLGGANVTPSVDLSDFAVVDSAIGLNGDWP